MAEFSIRATLNGPLIVQGTERFNLGDLGD